MTAEKPGFTRSLGSVPQDQVCFYAFSAVYRVESGEEYALISPSMESLKSLYLGVTGAFPDDRLIRKVAIFDAGAVTKSLWTLGG